MHPDIRAGQIISRLQSLKTALEQSPLFNMQAMRQSKHWQVSRNPSLFTPFQEAYDRIDGVRKKEQSPEALFLAARQDNFSPDLDRIDQLQFILQRLTQLDQFFALDEEALAVWQAYLTGHAYYQEGKVRGVEKWVQFLDSLAEAQNKAAHMEATLSMVNALMRAMQSDMTLSASVCGSALDALDALDALERPGLRRLYHTIQSITQPGQQSFSKRLALFLELDKDHQAVFAQVLHHLSQPDRQEMLAAVQREVAFEYQRHLLQGLNPEDSNAEFPRAVLAIINAPAVVRQIARGTPAEQELTLSLVEDYLVARLDGQPLAEALQQSKEWAVLYRLAFCFPAAASYVQQQLARSSPRDCLQSPDFVHTIVKLSLDAAHMPSVERQILERAYRHLPALLAQQRQAHPLHEPEQCKRFIIQSMALFAQQRLAEKEKLEGIEPYHPHFRALEAVIRSLAAALVAGDKRQQVLQDFLGAIHAAKRQHFYAPAEPGSPAEPDLSKLTVDAVAQFYTACTDAARQTAQHYQDATGMGSILADCLKALANWCIKVLSLGYQPAWFARRHFPTATVADTLCQIKSRLDTVVQELTPSEPLPALSE
ncbi:MAG: hypothetical protein JJT82_02310 [Legionellaceae bacterium]|nr:hypothetical protein [Legionellaceae bacterium]